MVDPIVQGALVSGGATLLGGALSGRQSGSANRDRKMQKDFAKKGVRWRVDDAVKAGLHPLAALGANIASPSPTSVGGGSSDYGIAQAGQQIGRALASRMTAEQKQLQDLAIRQETAKAEGYEIDNQIKQKRLTELGSTESGPAMDNFDTRVNPNSIFNIGDKHPGYITVPKQITAKSSPDTTVGSSAGYDRYDFGDYSIKTMNEKAAEAAENDLFTKSKVMAINAKQHKAMASAYMHTKESRFLPRGWSPKLQLPKKATQARRDIADMRRERAKLPKYRFSIYHMDPILGWKRVPATRENRKYFFTEPRNGERTNFTPY